MSVNRVEKHIINTNHNIYKIIDELSFKSKNLYNLSNYYTRQIFTGLSALKEGKHINENTKEIIDKLNEQINNINIKRLERNKIMGKDIKIFNKLNIDNKFISYGLMDAIMQSEDCYKELGSDISKQTLKILEQNWKGFFQSIKSYMQNKERFKGIPKLPNYKDKENGRFVVVLTNRQCKIVDNELIFTWKPLKEYKFKTNVASKLMQVRFIPSLSHYTMEIVYEVDVPEIESNESKRIASIDMGIDNLITLATNTDSQPIIINGKPLKSINQYYNKETSKIKSYTKQVNKKDWSKTLQRITDKRNNKVSDYMHKASKKVIDYLVENNIDTLVVGYNKGWKQECDIGKVNNQKFIQIPFLMLFNQLKYKCENVGIKFIETEESYTSGTSFIDGELPIKDNYNKARRIHRGLFKSNDGIKINADLNGAYQIMKKVFPNVFADGIDKLALHPLRINI